MMGTNRISGRNEGGFKNNMEITNLAEPPEAVGDERALWRAVVTQALMDAGSNSTKREMRLQQAQAISWLSGMSPDFAEVCDLAGLDPEYVRSRAREAIKRGCWWREYNPNSYQRSKGAKARRQLQARARRTRTLQPKEPKDDSPKGCIIPWPKKQAC